MKKKKKKKKKKNETVNKQMIIIVFTLWIWMTELFTMFIITPIIYVVLYTGAVQNYIHVCKYIGYDLKWIYTNVSSLYIKIRKIRHKR